jgi:hypothetical protein
MDTWASLAGVTSRVWTEAVSGCSISPMFTNEWFPDGIVMRGTRTGTVEEVLEPYSPESAERLAKTYAALWGEPIEWWGVGADYGPRNLAMPKQLHHNARPPRSRATQ